MAWRRRSPTTRHCEGRGRRRPTSSSSGRTASPACPTPWPLDTASDFFQRFVRGVVGFRIEVSRLEGKWKLNQNHSCERRERVVRVLEKAEDQDAREIARLMTERLKGELPQVSARIE